MMNTPENIREQLELYLRGELDSAQAAQVSEFIHSDSEWKTIHRQMMIEQQGIRLNQLKSNRQSLRYLEATLADQEKKIHSEGDLSAPSALSHRPNDSDGLEVKTKARDMEEETIDPANQHGIRYSNLRNVLYELKDEEKKGAGSAGPSKSISIGTGMRRIWLGAIAAGILFLVVSGAIILLNKTNNYNQNLLERFDDLVLNDYKRTNTTFPVETNIIKGYNFFYLKKFKKAKPILQNNWNVYQDTLSLYYLGLTNLIINKTQIGIDQLQIVENNKLFKSNISKIKSIINEKR